MSDLYAQLLARLGDFQAVDYEEEMAGQERALRAVLAKCAAMRAEHQMGAFIAEEFERVIADALGVKDEERIEKEERRG